MIVQHQTSRGSLSQAIDWMHRTADRLNGRDTLSLRQLLWVSLAACLAFVSRNPPLVLRAQFYAEDGVLWYAQAYNLGFWRALLLPDGGYLNTVQRLGAGLSLLVPLRWAPLVTVLFGMGIQLLPVLILLSARCRNWAPLPVRALMALLYVVMPNAREVHLVLTNAQWHLALCMLLLGLSRAPSSWPGRLFDLCVFLAGGLSGPFCVILLPVLAVFWWSRRQRWTLALLAADLLCVVVQGLMLRTHGAERHMGELGARLAPLIRMVGGNIVTSTLFGGYPFARFVPLPLLALAALGGLLIWLYTLRSAPLEWKLLIAFAALLLAAALRSPLVSGPLPLWDMLTHMDSGRYWFFPMLALVWSGVWCVFYASSRRMQGIARAMLLTMSFGIIGNWVYRPFPDARFSTYVQQFDRARPGDHVHIPIQPKEFTMELIKR